MRAGGAGRPWPAVAPLGAWLCGVCGAVRLEGILPVEPGNFSSFVGKFSFDQSLVAGNDSVELSGKVKVRVALEGSWADYTGEIYFMVFDDEVQHWNEDLMGSARSPVSGCDLRAQSSRYFRVSSRSAQKLHTFLITEKLRPRYWYFVVGGCEGPPRVGQYGRRSGAAQEPLPSGDVGPRLQYQIHAVNGGSTPSGEEEFSFDHQGLIRVHQGAAVAFALALLACLWTTRQRPGAQEEVSTKSHPYMQLVLLSLISSLCSELLGCGYYVSVASDGFGFQRLQFIGKLAAVVANCDIFLITTLAGTGWAIFRVGLMHRRSLMGAISLAGALFVGCELQAQRSIADASTQLYTYQSPAGLLVLALKVCIFCWFARTVRATVAEESTKGLRWFFGLLVAITSLWSLMVPVTVALAFLVSPCWRYKVVTTAEIAARLLTQAVLTWLFCGPVSPITPRNCLQREAPRLAGKLIDLEDAPRHAAGQQRLPDHGALAP
mmetsp:Transcript_97571/g.257640  ORF Transcript_97571/g.257640 Transcript_97571/m.257640 type:complete len:491 (+) Transcript_97571:61-1533(+)